MQFHWDISITIFSMFLLQKYIGKKEIQQAEMYSVPYQGKTGIELSESQ